MVYHFSFSIGRRLAVMGFMVLKIAASFLATYAPILPVVFFARFILGIGTMGVYTIFFVLSMFSL